MPRKTVLRGALIAVLCVVLDTPARAESIDTAGHQIVAAIVVAAVAVVILAAVIIHKTSSKRTITGCVTPGQNGMSLTDETDHRNYALSGNTAGVRPGDRVTLLGKQAKPAAGGSTLVWEASKVTKELGACQP
jgi:hypothetical protein